MGRIKTQQAKRVSIELYKKNKDQFKKTFAENKLLVKEMAEISSKKIVNVVSGYITRLVRSDKFVQ